MSPFHTEIMLPYREAEVRRAAGRRQIVTDHHQDRQLRRDIGALLIHGAHALDRLGRRLDPPPRPRCWTAT